MTAATARLLQASAAPPGESTAPAGEHRAAEITGSVHSWDLSTGVDGPGTRFVVFTAGCPLRCVYCHNPDTWFARNGRRMSAAEVLARAARYRQFIGAAGGGLTVSGGEPLLQPTFTRAILTGAKELGLHTALDTSGYLGTRADDALLDATDLVLLDIKSFDLAIARKVTGRGIGPTLAFARRLAARRQRSGCASSSSPAGPTTRATSPRSPGLSRPSATSNGSTCSRSMRSVPPSTPRSAWIIPAPR